MPGTYSVVYVWPDGRREVRYRRPINDNRLRDEVMRLQERLGEACPYRIEYGIVEDDCQ